MDRRFAAVGLLGGAAGAVVLPADGTDGRTDDTAEAALARGELGSLPESWRFLETLARAEFPGAEAGPGNLALLRGEVPALMERMREARDAGDRDLAALLGAAAYRLGGDLPLPSADAASDPRVRAWILATAAHERAAEGDLEGAARGLGEAAAEVSALSPGAAGRYVGEWASLPIEDPGGVARLALELDRRAEALAGLGFEELRGELLMSRGGLLMELGGSRPAVLQEAVQCFQKATQALPRKTHPVPYAMCHLNVAVAYLSMPMGRQAARLRAAIAVQSLREALEIFDPDAHGGMWEAATLNLANALQHLPSSHVGDNLVEAVSLYEGILARRPTPGPERARVLANLGNALAHLGDHRTARPHLEEARGIFERLGDGAAVEGIDGVLEEMTAAATEAG